MSDALAVTVVQDGATHLYRPRPDGGVDEFAVVASAFTPADAVRLTTALFAFVAECGIEPPPVVETTARRVRPSRPRAVGPRRPRPYGARGRPPGAPSWLDQVLAYLAEHPEGATTRELEEALPRPDLRSEARQRLSDYQTRGRVVRRGDRFFPPS